jgi:hypothetical protein
MSLWRFHQEEYRMRIAKLFAIAVVSIVPSLARADDTLVKFRGGIGVDGVSSAPGTDPTAATVNRNIVRGVQPAGTPWVIADFVADVKANGQIKAVGRGLIFSGGNTTGSALVVTPSGGTATLQVFATLICENLAPFVERNTKPVALSAEGNFSIDDVLSPAPSASCATPALLVRVAPGGPWFSAGIQKFDDGE